MHMSSSVDSQIANIESGLKDFVGKHDRNVAELQARTLTIEQTLASRASGGGRFGDGKSVGSSIVESDGFQARVKGAPSSGRIAVKSLAPPELKIVSGTWSAAPDFRPIVAFPPQQALPVRALMPNLTT